MSAASVSEYTKDPALTKAIEEMNRLTPNEDGGFSSYRSKGDQPIPYTVGDMHSVLMVKNTMARLALDIYNHNRKTKYTPIMVMGMAGFGKTTFDRHLVHELHKLDPSYGVSYNQNTDILLLDKILEAVPKQKPMIFVFDDVSYILENIRKTDRVRILDRLTRIREVLDPQYKETPSIMIMDYHYSYALPKTFRQSNFKIYLSATDEERENYLKQMGYYNKDNIASYIKIFIAGMRYNRFYIKNPHDDFNGGRNFVYYWDKPFRPALVSNYGELHLTMFHKIPDCQICAFKKRFDKPDPEFWIPIVRKYKFARVHKMLRIYAFIMTGHTGLLSKNDRTVYNYIKDHHSENKLDLIALEGLLRTVKKMSKAEQEAYFIDTLGKMEGREILKANLTEASIKDTLKEAAELAAKGDQDALDLPDADDDKLLDREFNKGINQLAGSFNTDDDSDDLETELDEADADDDEDLESDPDQ